jgi:hypothetical protein
MSLNKHTLNIVCGELNFKWPNKAAYAYHVLFFNGLG